MAIGTDQGHTKGCFPDRFAGQFGGAAQVFEFDLAESHKAQAHVLPGYRPVDCEPRCGQPTVASVWAAVIACATPAKMAATFNASKIVSLLTPASRSVCSCALRQSGHPLIDEGP